MSLKVVKGDQLPCFIVRYPTLRCPLHAGGKGDPSLLRKPRQTSAKMQNKGDSGPTKRTNVLNILSYISTSHDLFKIGIHSF